MRILNKLRFNRETIERFLKAKEKQLDEEMEELKI